MENNIKQLRIFFRISNAAFNFKNQIQLALSGNITLTKMEQLHKMALEVIEKENPDMSIIDKLLAEMEKTAEHKNQNPANGITFLNKTCI